MNLEDQEMMEVSERLQPPQHGSHRRENGQQSKRTSCWYDFTRSLSRFCGLEEEDRETADKWQLRLHTLQQDRVIGQGRVTEDETDGRACVRCTSRMPISLTTSSKRSQRVSITEARQKGIFSTTVDGVKDLIDYQHGKRKPKPHSRSFTPASIREFGRSRPYTDYSDAMQDVGYERFNQTLNDTFFSEPVGTGQISLIGAAQQQDVDEVDSGPLSSNWDDIGDWVLRTHQHHGQAIRIKPESLGFEAGFGDDVDQQYLQRQQRPVHEVTDPFKNLGFNADRRKAAQSQFSLLLEQGILSRLFDFKLSPKAKIHKHKHRPLFSIWMTFVQILIFIVSLSVYGLAPIGFDEIILSQEIIQPNLALKLESYREKANLWIGPRQADLIMLGAKFSPCMRRDVNVFKAIDNDREAENQTACCIYNDGAGCVQTDDAHCSDTLATWKKWTPNSTGGQDKRLSGSVCGQDPKFCKSPPSVAPFLWPDDITKWPVCTEKLNSKSKLEEDRHAVCDVVGRPCCMGIQGECIITTREHCTFYHGHFHEEASLCAQVNCMKDICGMLPFANPNYPDQFYRLWTCLFLHAGLIHLVITVLFNLFVMMSIEQTIGWIRTVIIYMGSGVCGSLASAIFVPYHVEAGASGSQFGLLATQLVLVILFTVRPWRAAWKILVFILVLLIIGLLPMVDNYAHLIGFAFGFLISFALLPMARFGCGQMAPWRARLAAIITCSGLALLQAVALIIFFYVAPIYNCPGCKYFNCIPFTPTFCDTMEVKIREVSML